MEDERLNILRSILVKCVPLVYGADDVHVKRIIALYMWTSSSLIDRIARNYPDLYWLLQTNKLNEVDLKYKWKFSKVLSDTINSDIVILTIKYSELVSSSPCKGVELFISDLDKIASKWKRD